MHGSQRCRRQAEGAGGKLEVQEEQETSCEYLDA